MLQHYNNAPPSLRSISPIISLQVEQVILKALAKNPEERFPTIMHFAEALHAALQEDPWSDLYLHELANAPTSTTPAILSDVLRLPTIPPQVLPPPAPSVLSPERVLAYIPDIYTPGTESAQLQEPSLPTPHFQKQLPRIRPLKLLIVLLCLALLIGGGIAIWLVVSQQGQALSTAIESSPVVANGAVYVGSDDDKIYAFELPGSF
jgi:hypothetical protein